VPHRITAGAAIAAKAVRYGWRESKTVEAVAE
jgi:hypothetical protein